MSRSQFMVSTIRAIDAISEITKSVAMMNHCGLRLIPECARGGLCSGIVSGGLGFETSVSAVA